MQLISNTLKKDTCHRVSYMVHPITFLYPTKLYHVDTVYHVDTIYTVSYIFI